MEMTMFIPLLLLICSFSTAQLQEESDNKNIPHGKQTESRGGELANASHQQPACPQDIHAVLREMTALLTEQRVEIRHLQRDNEAQKTVMDNLKQEISHLQRDNEGEGHVGPFNTQTPLVFRHVVTNIGNAYNQNTGAVLFKNGEHIVIAYEHQSNGHGTSANGATLLLEVGDVVFLRLWGNTRIYDSENHHSTFSGHLLFTM
ncbi:complement C1q-like protein 2 [Scomber scombrus]|uniref:Complement C1q-like protein 2 n=1 Tax=Scomber scombrus TaxID=13677 RepID=A0AAV1QL09_SCOSC